MLLTKCYKNIQQFVLMTLLSWMYNKQWYTRNMFLIIVNNNLLHWYCDHHQQEELQKFVSLSSWNPEVYPMLSPNSVVCATILPHRYILWYIQVQCCPPPPQLHSNFAGFINAVCPVTKITTGEMNPDTNLSTANVLPEPHCCSLETVRCQ